MAEQEHGISQTPPQPSEASNVFENSVSDFDEKTMRRCKPGCKRLFLTLTVFVSFLCGYPFLMKSIEIYRSPLPFRDIDALSRSIESTPLQFPCHFQAIFIGFDQNSSFKSNVDDLSVLISNKMRLFINKNSPCGSCSDNFTISVVLDSAKECMRKQIGGKGEYEWQCGVIREADFDTDEESVDDMLETVLGSVRKVYSVVVVKRDNGGQIRAVVGKHQHAWVVGWIDEIEAVLRVAEIFVKVFINGGKEVSSIRGEFMPVGADGKIVLSFNLLNADPRDWIYEWDFKKVDEMLLAPVIEALGPIANISVESQVLYHTPKSLLSHWNDNMKGYTVSTKDLPFFVNSNEWHLDTSIAAGGRSKVLQIAVYIPSAKECPLLLQLPDGEISATNGFISPMWGGVIIWNPPDCLSSRGRGRRPSRHTVPLKDLQKIFEVFMGQLRQLFGLKSENMLFGISGSYSLLASDKGFSKWELDVLARQHTCFNLLSCATTLASLSRLVQSLPRMIIMDDIGKQVKYSLEAAKLAQSNASAGIYDASAVSSKHARSLAEDAFFHPSIMSVSYYSFEHCFAVYSPFFLPVLLHVILAAIREGKRYKQERAKYSSWVHKMGKGS